MILLMTYHTRVCFSNALTDHPPTLIALRNSWTAPYNTPDATFGVKLNIFLVDLPHQIKEGPFLNHVVKIWDFLTPPPPYVVIFISEPYLLMWFFGGRKTGIYAE